MGLLVVTIIPILCNDVLVAVDTCIHMHPQRLFSQTPTLCRCVPRGDPRCTRKSQKTGRQGAHPALVDAADWLVPGHVVYPGTGLLCHSLQHGLGTGNLQCMADGLLPVLFRVHRSV